ncbi:sodium channel and clathrin linker 1-like [Diabrotica virgifera virgifera]|uniref:Sodium channel and clathrin linker 1-like n=1 Tax=Diabrotica virgifera virgifera TaxID=50390 RepID=A0A6P7FK51_DIAVI|nr:sodium channel and clathrin linker 1-like [Diabrotica virgifera virgifera]
MDVAQFETVIADYEAIVKDLTHELRIIQSEHRQLKEKIPLLVGENQRILEELKHYSSAKQLRESVAEEELIQNLKLQIGLVLKEKDQVTQLWRKANRSVEILESELNIYKSDTTEFFPKNEYFRIKEKYEENIRVLDVQLKAVQKRLESKNLEVKTLLQNATDVSESLKASDSKITDLNKKISDLEDACEHCNRKSKEKDKLVQKIMEQNSEYKEKIIEAIEVVQAALNEKDASLLREATIRSEMKKMNDDLDRIIGAIEEKCNKDIVVVKQDAEKRYTDLLDNHRKLQDELNKKILDIEKMQAKNIILQNEIDRFSLGATGTDDSRTSKLLILEKNLESTFQKLLVSEKHNIQVNAELDTVKNDMEQMAAHYERVLKAKDVERLSLQNSINQLESFINEKDISIKSLSNELERQKDKVSNVTKDFETYVENQNKVMAEVENRKYESTALFKEHIKELEAEIDMKEKINKKILEETKDVITKFENGIRKLKHETKTTKKENIVLKTELDNNQKKMSYYKDVLQKIAADTNHITSSHTNLQHVQPNVPS